MPTQRVAVAVGSALAVAGAYALFEGTRAPYQPRAADYAKATAAVAAGVVFPQAKPPAWVCLNREILDAALPRPEVSGVNRALNEHGVGLRDKELALFLVQLNQGMNPFEPGADLAAERLISHSFGEEHAELMEEGAANPEWDEKTLAQIRTQAAAAKVGETAHFLYGAVKASFSYGAAIEDDLGMGTYNEIVIDGHLEEVEAKASKKRELIAEVKPAAAMATTKDMREFMHMMRDAEAMKDAHAATEQDRQEPPKLA
ncbi:hypothetical protein [Legionella hackeliae]|uniref:Uncharacterized protein n=1 Tax=Legionella hackeliae TaxID=449 RepID=A0A0A8UQL5_LEGHA|nr:hypothetical protein [Legionella hackeliae]KTD10322.1 hypothetical protein Lhac_2690 [Legionella hackeliae]CEK09821.1 exported protein of unknown function [Legionella hackeliae]STX49730.1 Uncharacterised protein [Legionella hackeliae]